MYFVLSTISLFFLVSVDKDFSRNVRLHQCDFPFRRALLSYFVCNCFLNWMHSVSAAEAAHPGV